MRRERHPEPEVSRISPEELAQAVDVPEVVGAYLVGSWAQGYADALSDVDLALWLRPELPANQLWALLDQLYARLEQMLPGHELDLIPLNALPPAKQYMILKGGIQLFCKDPELCADWEVRAARFYLDERPFREEFARRLLERLQQGGTPLVDRELVADRLARLEEFLKLLEPLARMDRETFCQDPYRYGSAERFLQLGIEAALDIGHHLVARLGLGRPQSYAEIFQMLERGGILDPETARAMGQLARFRNRLVHLYWEVDRAQVHALLPDAIRDLREFMKAIAGFLGS